MRAIHASGLSLFLPTLMVAGCELVAGFGDPKLGDPSGATGTGATTSSTSPGVSTPGSSTTGGGTTGGGTTSTTSSAPLDCDAGTSACPSGCADLQGDQHNCGRCSHDCIGGQCLAGVCQAWTIMADAGVATNGMTTTPLTANQIDS